MNTGYVQSVKLYDKWFVVIICRYSPALRAEIGKYCSLHGVAATSRHFSRRLGINVSETTAHSIKKAYLKGLEKRRAEDEGDVTLLPVKKRGRPVLLGDELDQKVQAYLRRVRDGGGVVSSRIVLAAARGILLSTDKLKLLEYGGHVQLNST